MDVDFPTIA